MKRYVLTFLLFATYPLALAQPFRANWISTDTAAQTAPSSWHCYRKALTLRSVPRQALARIATDTKYWLWVNGKQVVYEGGLKRGPNPRDTYHDVVDLAPYLRPGQNTLAVLVWFWGTKGFSNHNSGRSALFFDMQADGLTLLSGSDWKALRHPAYEPSRLSNPNFRLSEPNIRFDAQRDIPGWEQPSFNDKNWPAAVALGPLPMAPWNALVQRPIPMFRDFGVKRYVRTERRAYRPSANRASASPAWWGGISGDTVVGHLPYDAHVSPRIRLRAGPGQAGQRIIIQSDTYYLGAASPTDSIYTLTSEYIVREGEQAYESLGWLSGHEIRYILPPGVDVLGVDYRETGYDASFSGTFSCNDPALNTLWQKAQRSLYVNMRDNYMDCPDRERAQWAGDGAMGMAQAFYCLDRRSDGLSRKLLLDIVRWQKPDSVIYNPVPETDWKKELPAHSLMPLSETERYVRFTRDSAIVREIYPALKKYLALWQMAPSGQLTYRPGGWDWGDWGEHQDYVLIQHGWYLRATQTAAWMAQLLGQPADATLYAQRAARITTFLNSPDCWDGRAYRYETYNGQTDDRANALMVLAGVADATKWNALATVFAEQRHASPYMEKFVLESLFKMGRPLAALIRMRQRFGPMIQAPYSTLWELWDYDPTPGAVRGNSGYNHGWSGGPLVLLSEYVAGITPDPARADTYHIRPTLAGLTRVNATFPTRHGMLSTQIRRQGRTVSMVVNVPPGVTALVQLPADAPYRKQTLNGKAVSGSGRLTAGRYVLTGTE